MKKELILKGRADAFNHIRWRFMTQKKFVESISVRLMCDRCGSRRNEVMWCQSVWWDKGTGLMWMDGMHALWDGGKDAVQTGTMHLTRDPKMHHAFVLFYIYIYFFESCFISSTSYWGSSPSTSSSQWAGTWHWQTPPLSAEQGHVKRFIIAQKTLRGAPFCFGILSFFFNAWKYSKPFVYMFSLTYNAMDETRQVAWISKGRGNSNLK